MELFHELGVALDAMTTSQVTRGSKSWGEMKEILLNADHSRERRFRMGINMVGRYSPGLESQLARFFTRPEQLSSGEMNVQDCIGFGEEQTVFLREGGDVRDVIKVERGSLGRDMRWLDNRLRLVSEVGLQISSFFDFYEPIIMPEEMSIGSSHIPFMMAILSRQQYLADLRDFFKSFDIQDIQRMMKDDTVFSDQVHFFKNQFVRQLADSGSCVDILGDRNLSVVSSSNGFRLVFIEGHMVHNTEKWGTSVHHLSKKKRLAAKIAYLGEIVSTKVLF